MGGIILKLKGNVLLEIRYTLKSLRTRKTEIEESIFYMNYVPADVAFSSGFHQRCKLFYLFE